MAQPDSSQAAVGFQQWPLVRQVYISHCPDSKLGTTAAHSLENHFLRCGEKCVQDDLEACVVSDIFLLLLTDEYVYNFKAMQELDTVMTANKTKQMKIQILPCVISNKAHALVTQFRDEWPKIWVDTCKQAIMQANGGVASEQLVSSFMQSWSSNLKALSAIQYEPVPPRSESDKFWLSDWCCKAATNTCKSFRCPPCNMAPSNAPELDTDATALVKDVINLLETGVSVVVKIWGQGNENCCAMLWHLCIPLLCMVALCKLCCADMFGDATNIRIRARCAGYQ